MAYFDDVELNDEVYSLIYGKGRVKYVLDVKLRTTGFYIFQVEFKSADIFYTEDGIPEWCSKDGNCQTVYYKGDPEMPELDFQTIDKDLLSRKKILKLKEQGKLEMRVPSGAWMNVNEIPPKVYIYALKHDELYLFRKAQ